MLAYLGVILSFSYAAYSYNSRLGRIMDTECTNDKIINKAILFVANKARNSSIAYILYSNIVGVLLLIAQMVIVIIITIYIREY